MRRKTTLDDGLSALRAVGLTDEEIDLAASYLHDRCAQGEIADRMGMNQTTVSLRLRGIMARVEAAGLPLTRPARRTSKPPWVPDRPMTVSMDPHVISRMCATRDQSGLIHGRMNGVGDRAEMPTDAETAPKRLTTE